MASRSLLAALLVSAPRLLVAGDMCSDSNACASSVDADASGLVQIALERKPLAPAPVNKPDKSVQADLQPIKGSPTLADFKKGSKTCYDRKTQSQWAVVDAHLHPRPFGGAAVPFPDLLGWMRRAGVLFTTLYGIGQRLPVNSSCTYYLDCPGTPIRSSLKNDFYNAQSVLDNNESLMTDPTGPVVTLSMSFLELHEPDEILPRMKVLQGEYPGMFKWVGEINLVKQALWKNSAGLPIAKASIAKWAPFMEELRKQDVPIALHCDLGNDQDGTEFLPLMDEVLKSYPDNKIIWMHMAGLSLQLDPKLKLLQVPLLIPEHVKIIKERLDKYPNLSVDLSWDVLYKELYIEPAEEKHYVKLLNDYPTRFVSGSDHVAAVEKTEVTYRAEVERTSVIYSDLSDEAFRNIALGENYFALAGLDYAAPKICAESVADAEVASSVKDEPAKAQGTQQEPADKTPSPASADDKASLLHQNQEADLSLADDALTLADFEAGSQACYDRSTRNQYAVVDAHLHSRPFGGPAVPFEEQLGRLRRAGVLFATLYGIGQRLPTNSTCTYYLDCPGTPIESSLKNDFWNGQSVLEYNESLKTNPAGPVLTLAMSFLDLHAVDDILPRMKLLQGEFPGMFNWVGEINVAKQALWNNSAGLPVAKETIATWAPFMEELRKQDIPIALHCDLGNDEDGTKFLPLMDEIFRLYPDNKVIWMHMAGLSLQLDPKLKLLQVPLLISEHVEMIKERLDKYPKLSIDLSWDVLYKELYNDPDEEKHYVDLLNKYPTRFLSGSDHVAAAEKTEDAYRSEVARTSAIYRDLSDEAFRNIALGQNYFALAGLKYTAPKICMATEAATVTKGAAARASFVLLPLLSALLGLAYTLGEFR